MKKFYLLVLIFYAFTSIAGEQELIRYPQKPVINAPSYLLVDYHSGKILAAQDANKRLEPASLTKMMTMYVVDQEIKSGRLNINDEVVISKNAWKTQGSRTFVAVGSRVPLKELMQGIIIQSGNDATVALVEHIAGSEENFAELMNEQAKKLNMINTHFVNATGLPDPNHYTTALDLAILSRAMIRDFPQTYKIYSQKEFLYNGIKQINRNKLLWRNEYVDGIKTGFTDSAGYCLAASAMKDGMRLLAIVMGANTESERTVETNKLITWGLRFFQTKKIYHAGTPLKQIRVWSGTPKVVFVGLKHDVYVTLPYGYVNSLHADLEFNQLVTAPLLTRTELGKYYIMLRNQIVDQYPLVSLQEVKRANIIRRSMDKCIMYTRKVIGLPIVVATNM